MKVFYSCPTRRLPVPENTEIIRKDIIFFLCQYTKIFELGTFSLMTQTSFRRFTLSMKTRTTTVEPRTNAFSGEQGHYDFRLTTCTFLALSTGQVKEQCVHPSGSGPLPEMGRTHSGSQGGRGLGMETREMGPG